MFIVDPGHGGLSIPYLEPSGFSTKVSSVDFTKKINVSFFAKIDNDNYINDNDTRIHFDFSDGNSYSKNITDFSQDEFIEYNFFSINGGFAETGSGDVIISINGEGYEDYYDMWIDDFCVYYNED